jgi:hypothetical protein
MFWIDMRLLFLNVVVIAAPKLSIGSSSGRPGMPGFVEIGDSGGDGF